MTFINESRMNKGLGFLALQHHNSSETSVGDQGYTKDGRHAIFGARVLGRMMPESLGGTLQDPDGDGFMGPYIADGDAFGDLIGSFLWNHSVDAETAGNDAGPTDERGFPAWRWSWPVVKAKKESSSTRGVVKRGGVMGLGVAGSPSSSSSSSESDWKDCPKLTPNTYQPTKEGSKRDIDFALKELGNPYPGLNFPIGHLGLGMSGTEEWSQDETYFPTDPRLFAVNNESDVHMSSQVCDVRPDPDFDIDLEKTARLHSFFRVIDNGPFCEQVGDICGDMEQKTLAWNITLSGCEDAYGGWVYDGKKDIAGAVEYDGLNGPFVLTRCKHKLHDHGTSPHQTIVGEPPKQQDIHPLHIHLGAFFSDSAGTMDGPKHHKGPWPSDVEDMPYKTYAWLAYDDCEEDDKPRCLGKHPFVCKPDGEKGWHRWYSQSSHTTHNPPPDKDTGKPEDSPTGSPSPGEEAKPPAVVPPPEGFDPGIDIGLPPGLLPPPARGADGQPVPERLFRGAGDVPDILQFSPANEGPGELLEFAPGVNQKKQGPTYVPQGSGVPVAGQKRCYMMTTLEQGSGSFLFRPQHISATSIDYRNWFNQSEDAVESEQKYTPAVARLEAFGHQDPNAKKGPFCPGWEYTADSNEPDGDYKGRYECKTADGGVVFMAPEYGMENLAGIAPDPGATSTSTFLMAPNTKLAFGLPDLETGKLSTTAHGDSNGGFNIYVGSSGELRIDTADGVNALFIKETGYVQMGGGIESTPSIAVTDKVTAVEDVATGKATTIGSITPLTRPTNITKTIAWDGAGGSGTIATVPTDQGFLYTKDAGGGVLDLYFKNSSGEVKLN